MIIKLNVNTNKVEKRNLKFFERKKNREFQNIKISNFDQNFATKGQSTPKNFLMEKLLRLSFFSDGYKGERYKVEGGGVYKVQVEGVYKVQRWKIGCTL